MKNGCKELKKVDFLRHIVNYVLSSRTDIPRQVVDEVRSKVEKAEEKYNFSAFGGNVTKLAEYIKSSDFDELVKTLKTFGYIQVVIDILKLTKEKYKDVPEIVNTIDERLKTLEIKEETTIKELEDLTLKVEEVVKDRAVIERIGNTINVNLRGVGNVRIIYNISEKKTGLDVDVKFSRKDVGWETIEKLLEVLLRFTY